MGRILWLWWIRRRDATVLVGALRALKLDHYGRKKRSATAVAEPWVGSYGYGGYGYGGYGGYGAYGRKRREAEPLSALDILTMDSTVLVQALQNLKLDHYGKKISGLQLKCLMKSCNLSMIILHDQLDISL